MEIIKVMVIAPTVAMLILSIAAQMTDLAESTGEQVVAYATEMDSAVSCAFQGELIEKCSEGISDTSFDKNIDSAQKEFNKTKQQIQTAADNLENQ